MKPRQHLPFSACAPLVLAVSSVLLICGGSCNVFAQQLAPSLSTQKTLGGSSVETGGRMKSTRDGGYIWASESWSVDGDVKSHRSLVSTEKYDFWVIKLDSIGAIQWDRSFGGSDDEWVFDVQQTRDDGYIVVGGSRSNDGDVVDHHGPAGASDYWVVKLDSLGNTQWMKSYGGEGTDYAFAIQEARSNGYVIAGKSENAHDDTIHTHGGWDCRVIRVDTLGDIIWDKCFGGSGSDEATDILCTEDGGFIVVANTSSNDGDLWGSVPGVGGWIFKVDSVGAIKWSRLPGETGGGALDRISRTFDGGYILAGNSGTDSNGAGDSDFWIVKVDSLGKKMWEKKYGGTQDELAFDIKQTSDNGFIVGGTTTSSDGVVTGYHIADTLDWHSYSDIWIVKLDVSGKLQWQKCLGGNDVDGGPNVFQTKDNGYCIGAWVYSTDGDVVSSHGPGELWFVKLAFPPIISSARQISPPPLICTSSQDDTMWIHNTGSKVLAISSATFSAFNSSYAVIVPATLPDSIQPGDSSSFVIRFAPAAAGSLPTTLQIINSDTIAGHNPWLISISGRRDSIAFAVQNVANDTIDFGIFSCNADTSFLLMNASTIRSAFSVQSGPGIVLGVGPSVALDSGAVEIIRVRMQRVNSTGRSISWIAVGDSCGHTDTVVVLFNRDSAALAFSQIQDSVVCPGDSLIQKITVRNTSHARQTLHLASTAMSFTIAPDSLPLDAGDSATVTLVFHGSQINGTFATFVEFSDDCGEVAKFSSVVHVISSHLAMLPIIDTTLCPFTAVRVPLLITNADSIPHDVTFTSSATTLSQQAVTIAPKQTDTLIATFTGADAGTYPCVVHVVDECGAHDVTITINVRYLPPLQFTLHTNPSPALIGSTQRVFVVATPLGALTDASNASFTITNEPTALSFDHALTSNTVSVVPGTNAVRLSVVGDQSITSDTIATLFYKTLVGSTLAPSLQLLNTKTTNACQAVTGAGTATINLLPPGCELGTVRVHPFTSSIQSVYPNPATGATTINYATIENANVTIEVFDALGRRTQTLIDATHQPGTYSVMLDAHGMAAGVYCITLREGKYLDKRELVVGR